MDRILLNRRRPANARIARSGRARSEELDKLPAAASAFAAVASAIAFANLTPLFFIKAGAPQALAI